MAEYNVINGKKTKGKKAAKNYKKTKDRKRTKKELILLEEVRIRKNVYEDGYDAGYSDAMTNIKDMIYTLFDDE